MAKDTSLTYVFAKRPAGEVVPGETFRPETVPAPTEADLQEGDVLLETHYVSLDPSMRTWLKNKPGYLPPLQIGDTMRSVGAGVVLASKNPAFKVGDWATGFTGWREITKLGPREALPAARLPGVTMPDLLGAVGLTGMTALLGLEKVGQPKAGDLVVVSGAAGATGSIVGQICKLKGCRVVGIAGSSEKCAWLKELGYDVALNYKDSDFREQFLEATKDKIDVYWDNVGGEILDLALGQAKLYGRIVACGSISTYNSEGEAAAQSLKNLSQITLQRLKMQGFIIVDYGAEFAGAAKQLATWLSEGKIQSRNTVVKGGLEKAEYALVDLFKGINTGKLVVEVKELAQ